jgi:hypothetical protein
VGVGGGRVAGTQSQSQYSSTSTSTVPVTVSLLCLHSHWSSWVLFFAGFGPLVDSFMSGQSVVS